MRNPTFLLPAANPSQPYVLLTCALLAAFAWLTPTHALPWTSFHSEMAMASAAVIGGTWVLWSSRREDPALPRLLLLSMLLALIPLAQWALGLIVFAGDAVLCSLYLLAFALIQIVGYRAVKVWGHARTLEACSWFVLAVALASCWLALYQWQQLEYLGFLAIEQQPGARLFANVAQPNHLATLLVLAMVATAGLQDAGRFGVATAAALLVLLGFVLAMTQSRAGYLEVLVVGSLIVATRRAVGRRVAVLPTVFGVSIVLLMSWAWHAANAALGQAVVRRAAAELVDGGPRLIHWASMTKALLLHPWGGYGWNQTMLAQYAVAPDYPATREVLTYAHNLVLELLLWNGLPLGLTLAGGLAWWFWGALRRVREPAAMFALAGVVAVFVHALVETPLYYAYFMLPVAFLMGTVSAACNPRGTLKLPGWALPLLTGLAALATSVVAFDYLGLERDVQALRFEARRIGLDKPRHVLSQPVLLTQVGAFTRFARTPEHAGMSEPELQSMAKIVERFPSGENIVRYASALALNQRPEQAGEALRRVCKIQDEAMCERMQALWRGLGLRAPEIARVPWPSG